MRNQVVFVLFLVFLFTLSCNRPLDKEFATIDVLLTSHPDSALLRLNQIRPEMLVNKQEHARFALLLNEAYDKNYYYESDDSLINIAVNYYSGRRDPQKTMKAWYYQGIVRENAGNYSSAIISFEKAGKMAEELNDRHYLGLVYRHRSYIFNATHNIPAAIENSKLEWETFRENDDTLFAQYAQYEYAVALTNNKDVGKARAVLNEMLEDKELPLYLHDHARILLAENYIIPEDSLQSAIQIYRTVPEDYLTTRDYAYCALAEALTGQMDSAYKSMERAYQVAEDILDTETMNYMSAKIDSVAGDFFSAYNKVRRASEVQDSVTRVLHTQVITTAQRDYFKQELHLQEGILKQQRTVIISGIIITLLLLLTGSLGVLVWKRKQEAAFKEQMARLSLLQQTSRKDSGSLIGTLFLEQVTHLSSLSGAYYAAGDEEVRLKYYMQFKQVLKELQSSKTAFDNLERDLNRYCSDVMGKLATQMPAMKRNHRQAFALLAAGIPDEAVQIILGLNSLGSLRTFRSRLRTEIKEANVPDEELFLGMLSTEKQPRKKTKD